MFFRFQQGIFRFPVSFGGVWHDVMTSHWITALLMYIFLIHTFKLSRCLSTRPFDDFVHVCVCVCLICLIFSLLISPSTNVAPGILVSTPAANLCRNPNLKRAQKTNLTVSQSAFFGIQTVVSCEGFKLKTQGPHKGRVISISLIPPGSIPQNTTNTYKNMYLDNGDTSTLEDDLLGTFDSHSSNHYHYPWEIIYSMTWIEMTYETLHCTAINDSETCIERSYIDMFSPYSKCMTRIFIQSVPARIPFQPCVFACSWCLEWTLYHLKSFEKK